MAEWDRRLIAAIAVYGIGFLLWFIGFWAPDTDDTPMTPIGPPSVFNATPSVISSPSRVAAHSKISISAFFLRTVVNAGTIGVPIMGLACITMVLYSAKNEKLALIGGSSIVSGFLSIMFLLAGFFAISETERVFNRVLEGAGMIFCFGALVATAGVSYLIYKEQKQVAARGYSVFREDIEERQTLVADGLATDSAPLEELE